MRPRRAHRSSGLLRSLTLLRTFLLASAAILAVGGVVLSSRLSGELRELALEDSARDVSLLVDAVVPAPRTRGDRLLVARGGLRRLERTVRRSPTVRGASVWSRSGRLVFSTTRPKQVGRRLRLDPAGAEAIRTNAPQAAVIDQPGASPTIVEVWSPVSSPDGRVVGATEVILDEAALDDATAGFARTVWVVVLGVLAVLWLGLAVLVRGASWRLQRQNDELHERSHELLDSTRELESTLVEMIETLNAAVEARDPYTAGHSQRVRRVALAVGRELRLPAKQLGTLGRAALFHDIGKIGMPDAILTKPDRLSRSELQLMREHVTRGAEIVARIHSFRDSVPAVRHHHERWDGLGYPDGLAGTDVPLEAAIIGLADAWDAMVTDRPYRASLQLSDALGELREGRGKQFSPAVVDAFLAVAKRQPADVLPPEESLPYAAVVVA